MSNLSLAEMKDALNKTQAEMLELLDSADTLYHNPGADAWPSGLVVYHLSEAREFFASELRTLQKNMTSEVGRGLKHEGRLANIEAGLKDKPERETLKKRLKESFDTVMAALDGLSESDLDVIIHNRNPKFGDQSLRDFAGHFIVEHDQKHALQARERLGEGVI